jgi:hypothetical protein
MNECIYVDKKCNKCSNERCRLYLDFCWEHTKYAPRCIYVYSDDINCTHPTSLISATGLCDFHEAELYGNKDDNHVALLVPFTIE